jgi:hypothetical protein
VVRDGRLDAWKYVDSGRSVDLQDVLDAPGVLAEGKPFFAPIRVGGEVVATLQADSDRNWPAERAQHRAAGLELLARHAGRALEALTAWRLAQLRGTPPSDGGVRHPVDLGEAAETDAARRYARLLISEIKLYHEPAVTEGRVERDLGARLGGEIAHARALYDRRFGQFQEADDIFRAEVVRTLADGDDSLLGEPPAVDWKPEARSGN